MRVDVWSAGGFTYFVWTSCYSQYSNDCNDPQGFKKIPRSSHFRDVPEILRPTFSRISPTPTAAFIERDPWGIRCYQPPQCFKCPKRRHDMLTGKNTWNDHVFEVMCWHWNDLKWLKWLYWSLTVSKDRNYLRWLKRLNIEWFEWLRWLKWFELIWTCINNLNSNNSNNSNLTDLYPWSYMISNDSNEGDVLAGVQLTISRPVGTGGDWVILGRPQGDAAMYSNSKLCTTWKSLEVSNKNPRYGVIHRFKP